MSSKRHRTEQSNKANSIQMEENPRHKRPHKKSHTTQKTKDKRKFMINIKRLVLDIPTIRDVYFPQNSEMDFKFDFMERLFCEGFNYRELSDDDDRVIFDSGFMVSSRNNTYGVGVVDFNGYCYEIALGRRTPEIVDVLAAKNEATSFSFNWECRFDEGEIDYFQTFANVFVHKKMMAMISAEIPDSEPKIENFTLPLYMKSKNSLLDDEVEVGRLWIKIIVDSQDDNYYRDYKKGKNKRKQKRSLRIMSDRPHLSDLYARNFGEEIIDYLIQVYYGHPNKNVIWMFEKLLFQSDEKYNPIDHDDEPGQESKELQFPSHDAVFEKVLYYLCANSSDPLGICIEACIECSKQRKKHISSTNDVASRKNKTRWTELKEITSNIALNLLDLYDHVPTKYYKYLEGSISRIAKKVVDADLESIAAHQVIHEDLTLTWKLGAAKNSKTAFAPDQCWKSFYTPKISFFAQGLAFLVFLFILIYPIIIETASRDTVFWFRQNLENTIIAPFSEVQDAEGFWNFMKGTITDLQGKNTSFLAYNGDQMILRQFVASKKNCTDDPTDTRVCYGPYVLGESPDYKGKTGTFENRTGSIYSGIYSYVVPEGGLSVIIDTTQNISQQIEPLEAEKWIDDSTRMVILEILVYNRNRETYGFVTCIYEISSFGQVSATGQSIFIEESDLRSIPDFRDILLWIFIINYLALELEEMLSAPSFRVYIVDFWNIIDLITYLGLLALTIIDVVILPLTVSSARDIESLLGIYIGFYTIRFAISLLTLLSFLRALYYFRSFSSTGPMVIAIQRMIFDVILFLVLSATALIAFGQFFTALLHDVEPGFITLLDTSVSLTSQGLGDFEFFAGYSLRIFFANVMLLIYLLLMLIVLVNLLIAMMGFTYETVINNATEKYRFEFADIVLHYSRRTYLPPPLTVISLIYRVCRQATKVVEERERKLNPNEGVRRLIRLFIDDPKNNEYLKRLTTRKENPEWNKYIQQKTKLKLERSLHVDNLRSSRVASIV
eukprot:TRINITY_DN3501_c1_g1_i1.p1 TRINITY_DN3501_c1_g1~~TRINITY_DN3501_c1_g1_i1.p1  ORF type:complete len:1006 (-),score=196.39 TRINITY_DN3501_c1_g1_i1:430-3447(-)